MFQFGSVSTTKVQSGSSVFENLESQLDINLFASGSKQFPEKRGLESTNFNKIDF